MNYYIKDATLVNEGLTFVASVFVSNGLIAKIVPEGEPFDYGSARVVDGKGKFLIPGIIDEHVHFREPGLTHKADIHTESRAAVAGGVTSFMDMPNTVPQTTTQELLQQKFDLAAEKSLANYSFYLGTTNDNLAEVVKTDPKRVCGVKLFMGSSTGNMLVDNDATLERLFRESPCLIAAHCEDEGIINRNANLYKMKVMSYELNGIGMMHHHLIRTIEACYESTAKAVALAKRTGARLHVLHVSSQPELTLFREDIPLEDKKITAETCPHFLYLNTDVIKDNARQMGFAYKCNPAIKTSFDQEALLKALRPGLIDTIGSDHAPHQRSEKDQLDYFQSKSGFPSIEHSLDIMLNLMGNSDLDVNIMREYRIDFPLIVRLMCHNPAILYRIDRRGFIREGYHADLALVDLSEERYISNAFEYCKCGWSPYCGETVHSRVTHTFVNGNLVFENGLINEEVRGERLMFNA